MSNSTYARHYFFAFSGNIDAKLADLGVSKTNAQEFVRDIFGNPAMLKEGLVDVDSANLDTEFSALKEILDATECSLITNTLPRLVSGQLT